MWQTEWVELDDLDPAVQNHVSAVHEAGHAVAIDRTACALDHIILLANGHGDTGRGALDGVGPGEITRRDRVIALAGPEAERNFTGEVNADKCEVDEAFAAAATAYLGDDQGVERAAIAAALTDDTIWAVVKMTAVTLIESEGQVQNTAGLQFLMRQKLGEPPAGWPH